jgi:hypothetical protein
VVILLLLAGVYSGVTDPARSAGKRADPIFFMVMAGIFFGLFNTASEIVNERSIYLRERLAGVPILPYLTSKLLVLGSISVLQAFLLGVPLSLILGLAASTLGLFASLMLAALAAACMGLLLSALARRRETPLIFVPVIVVAQLILGGFLAPVKSTGMKTASAPMISRWGAQSAFIMERRGMAKKDAMCSVHGREDEASPNHQVPCEKQWTAYLASGRGFSLSSAAPAMFTLGALGLLFFLATAWVLRWQDPDVLRLSESGNSANSLST